MLRCLFSGDIRKCKIQFFLVLNAPGHCLLHNKIWKIQSLNFISLPCCLCLLHRFAGYEHAWYTAILSGRTPFHCGKHWSVRCFPVHRRTEFFFQCCQSVSPEFIEKFHRNKDISIHLDIQGFPFKFSISQFLHLFADTLL